jgi:hypothetical protein
MLNTHQNYCSELQANEVVNSKRTYVDKLKIRKRLQFSPIFVSILYILIISLLHSPAASDPIQYTEDERKILRQLFLKRFGLDQLVESRSPQALAEVSNLTLI